MEDWDNPTYTFNRNTQVATDTLMMRGRGPPAKQCGSPRGTLGRVGLGSL